MTELGVPVCVEATYVKNKHNYKEYWRSNAV